MEPERVARKIFDACLPRTEKDWLRVFELWTFWSEEHVVATFEILQTLSRVLDNISHFVAIYSYNYFYFVTLFSEIQKLEW